MQFIAESLRVSVFATEFADYRRPQLGEWWTQATGSEPEQVNQIMTAGQAAAEGAWEKRARFGIVATLGRVDWILSPPAQPVAEWPSVGTWPDDAVPWLEAAKRWVRELPIITRLAFGAVVVVPTADRAKGYEQLETALADLHLRLPENVTDFFIQFNLPVPNPRVPAPMRVNRLTRWGVAFLKSGFLQVAVVPGAPLAVAAPQNPELHALKAELDFSTPAEWTTGISAQDASLLLGELASMGVQFIQERVR